MYFKSGHRENFIFFLMGRGVLEGAGGKELQLESNIHRRTVVELREPRLYEGTHRNAKHN